MKKVLFAAVVGLLFVGCAPKNVVKLKRDAAAAEPIAGWYARDEGAYSIWVPENYQVPKNAGMSVGDLQNLSNPAVGYGMAPGEESTTANAALVLDDKSYKPIPGEPSTGLTVNVSKRGGGADLEGEAKKIKDDLLNEESMKLDLAVGPAYEIKHRSKSVGGDDIWRMIYIICDGESVYRFDFTTTNGASVISNVAPGVIQSFRVK
ncbi:MAG: hypothetical protein ACKVQS_04405 [Fimbriimonadaceae bacterium]